ncbi:bifunctional riboflavin kinase/FAD synthetase [Pelagibius litoralis]|uniref:Riboflavin biosynthesis protein n=1 Tax=Pelagibius litoralis TaxID=374515 RepID=A0A967F184_9PROT|nr:bifunctional riboflavin kinase/FAD synthetase [Pelagibius litoralis]NIA71164.1 bifunctional riboflavin kinase/FAD synthetase [Pelagibius litoralis]
MAIFRHSGEIPDEAKGCLVVIGNFDGVHKGHQALLADAREVAGQLGVPLAVLTFEPHPRSVFQPDQPPFRLTSLRAKAHALQELGVDHLFVLHFDRAFSLKPAEAFVQDILVGDLAARHVVVGWDFCFGHKRQGNVALLKSMGAKLGFGLTAVDPVMTGTGAVYSSSIIRQQLREGQPQQAARLLGRPWEIEGRVEKGDQRGRTIGFPTANLSLGDYLCPAPGVYAVYAGRDPGVEHGEETAWTAAVANLGRRPTVAGEDLRLEVHLFDFAGDLYGETLRVRLIEFLRPEKKFDGLDALQAQIALDCGQAREILAGIGPN